MRRRHVPSVTQPVLFRATTFGDTGLVALVYCVKSDAWFPNRDSFTAVCARRVIQRAGTHKHGKSDGM